MASTPTNTLPGWLQFLIQRRQQSAYLLFGLAATGVAAGVWLGYRHSWENYPVWVWLVSVGVIALGAGLIQLVRESGGTRDIPEPDYVRMIVLIAGGLLGLVTALLPGVLLLPRWWEVVNQGWPDAASTRETLGYLLRVLGIPLALIGGLAIMFLSLQLARTETRSSALMRRLLYGYNAVLTGLLLLGILALLNLLTYSSIQPFAALGKSYDWTTQSIYSLSPKSENILKELDKKDRPIKVFVIMRVNELYPRVRGLLENCQAASSKFQVEYLSPDRNQQRVTEILNHYGYGDQGQGLLVVYGSGDTPDSREFIKPGDLTSSSAMSSPDRPQAFSGESALMTAVSSMMENKQKPVVYFTQGRGEPDLRERGPRGGSKVKELLQDQRYVVKGLQFSPDATEKSDGADLVVSNRVPEDAAVVVIVGPREPFPPFAVDALRAYMEPVGDKPDKKKGKLIALLGVVPKPNEPDTMAELGLERFLGEFGVRVTNEVVLHDYRTTSPPIPPEAVLAYGSRDPNVGTRNLLVGAFAGQQFLLRHARPVQPEPPRQPGRPYMADVLLDVPAGLRPFVQTNLKQTDFEYVQELIKNNKLNERVSERSIPVAVTVSEDESAMPQDQFHAPVQGRKQTSRLVVYGNSSWLANDAVERGLYFDLFASSVGWLRERPADIGIEPKKSDVFTWNQGTNVYRMIGLPAVLALFGILGLGAGVWVARRR